MTQSDPSVSISTISAEPPVAKNEVAVERGSQSSITIAKQDAGKIEAISAQRSDNALKALGNVKLAITIDDSKNLPVIKIFDSESGEELLQVPAEHSLHISKTIKAAVGAIFDKKA